MADVDITGNRGPGFLQRSYGGIPMWGWIVGGVAVLFGISKMGLFGGNKATAQKTPARSGAPGSSVPGQPPNIFFLPQGTNPVYAPPTPNHIHIIVNREPGDGPDEEHPGNPPHVSPPEPVMPDNPAPPAWEAPWVAPPELLPAPADDESVVVEPWPGQGEGGLAQWNTTLWGIANHFGRGVQELADYNSIPNPSLIYPGQVVRIPR